MKTVSAPWIEKAQDVVTSLETNPSTGLPLEEVLKRQKKYGLNILKVEERIHPLIRLLNQFKSPVIIILLIASVVTGALREYTDSIAILVIVFINASIGYFQESKAEEAVEALKKLSAPRAKVVRESIVKDIPASDVCLGDILVLEAGDYVRQDRPERLSHR